MSYALHRRPVTAPRLLAFFAGSTLELAEIPFGPLSDLNIACGTDNMRRAHAMLGAALLVDGEPLGLEKLRALPGRLSHELSDLILEVARMHGRDAGPEDDDDDDDEDDSGDAGDGTPAARVNGAVPGEVLRA